MAEIVDDEPPGVPEWVVTYGDMMSLLLTFFIMLVSLSEMKKEGEIRAMLDSLKESFGSSSALVSGVPGTSLQENSIYAFKKSLGMRSENGMKKGSQDSDGKLGKHKSVERINHGSIVTLGGPTMFDRFSAELNDEIKASLNIIADIIRARPNHIVIRGHASPEPLPADSEYRDQFDLSFARAQAVASYLINEQDIRRERVVVSSAGETEPRLVTRDTSSQSLNRRVDVFLVETYVNRTQWTR